MANDQLVYLEYKCRHCGDLFNSVRITENKASIEFEEMIFKGATLRLLDTHPCKDGHIGLADLSGHTAPFSKD